MSRKNIRNARAMRPLAPGPAQIALASKPKKKPRGKPFERGNKYGLLSRWKPGESGNPAGRAPYKKLSESCRGQLAAIVPLHELRAAKLPDYLRGKTYAEVNAWVLQQEAMRGNISAVSELGDRSEGRAPTSLYVEEHQNDPIQELVVSMTLLSEQIGPPEQPREENDETDITRSGAR